MQPADTLARAAERWLRLLRTSTLPQAAALLRTDAHFTDLTTTQYLAALEWLKTLRLVVNTPLGLGLSAQLDGLSGELSRQVLLERALEDDSPPWLRDADILVPDTAALPADAVRLATTLGISDEVALTAIRHVHGKIDLAERARVGSAGEASLLELLEWCWPGSTVHVSARDDGFGYDIGFRHRQSEWHLEVKSTTRRGRLSVHLSRHEHEVGLRDPHWRLVVLGLDESLRLATLATARHGQILARAPADTCAEAKWQSVRHEIGLDDLEIGLNVVKRDEREGIYASKLLELRDAASLFAWMPS